MKYTQNGISIDTLQCEPACVNECGTLTAGQDMTVSAPVADGICTYTATATCTTGTMIEVH